jgi:hypothetical protein
MLVDQLITMEQRPHENPVRVAKGLMQYRWFRSKLKEQEVFRKYSMNFKAHIAVEDGKEAYALFGAVDGIKGANMSNPTIWPIMSPTPNRTILMLTPS